MSCSERNRVFDGDVATDKSSCLLLFGTYEVENVNKPWIKELVATEHAPKNTPKQRKRYLAERTKNHLCLKMHSRNSFCSFVKKPKWIYYETRSFVSLIGVQKDRHYYHIYCPLVSWLIVVFLTVQAWRGLSLKYVQQLFTYAVFFYIISRSNHRD